MVRPTYHVPKLDPLRDPKLQIDFGFNSPFHPLVELEKEHRRENFVHLSIYS